MNSKDLNRFLTKVKKGDSPDDCWEWTAARAHNGYGQFNMRGKTCRAHRVSFVHFVGPIPEGMFGCHKCDNPGCVNPEHIFIGNHTDNMRDRDEKGRVARGVNNGAAKLTESQVLKIRADTRTHYAIAADYPVSRTTISDIKRQHNKVWRHIL